MHKNIIMEKVSPAGTVPAHVRSSLWTTSSKTGLTHQVDCCFCMKLQFQLHMRSMGTTAPNQCQAGNKSWWDPCGAIPVTWTLSTCLAVAPPPVETLPALRRVVLQCGVQVLVVLMFGSSYEFYLLRAADWEAMKRFSVFLALPSATIRSMASRMMQVRRSQHCY